MLDLLTGQYQTITVLDVGGMDRQVQRQADELDSFLSSRFLQNSCTAKAQVAVMVVRPIRVPARRT